MNDRMGVLRWDRRRVGEISQRELFRRVIRLDKPQPIVTGDKRLSIRGNDACYLSPASWLKVRLRFCSGAISHSRTDTAVGMSMFFHISARSAHAFESTRLTCCDRVLDLAEGCVSRNQPTCSRRMILPMGR